MKKGTFGVAFNRLTGRTVPFVVGDTNSVIGGHINTFDVLWVFFSDKQGVAQAPYSGKSIRAEAKAAYERWGSRPRLNLCISNPEIPFTVRNPR